MGVLGKESAPLESVVRIESIKPYSSSTAYKVGETIVNARISIEVLSKNDSLDDFQVTPYKYYGYFIEGGIYFDKDELKILKSGIQPNVISGWASKNIQQKSIVAPFTIPYDRITRNLGMKLILNHEGEEFFCMLYPIHQNP